MADYYHMEHILKKTNAWPHGNVKGKWSAAFPRIVGPDSKHKRPSELVPEDLAKVTLSGVDTIWQTDATTYQFIEAKFSESIYSLHARLKRNTGNGTIPKAPASLNDRQLMLWTLLGEPKKGTQMSKEWITNSVKDKTMQNPANLKNRWVYLMLGTPAASNPFVTKPTRKVETGRKLALTSQPKKNRAEKDEKPKTSPSPRAKAEKRKGT